MAVKIGMHPAHPGSYVKSWVLPDGMTVKQASEHLGVTRQALDALLNERASLSPEMALRIEKAFGQPMDALLRMQLAYDAYAIRDREPEITKKVLPYCAA